MKTRKNRRIAELEAEVDRLTSWCNYLSQIILHYATKESQDDRTSS